MKFLLAFLILCGSQVFAASDLPFCHMLRDMDQKYTNGNCFHEEPKPTPTPDPTTPTPEGRCAPGWTKYEGHCYMFFCNHVDFNYASWQCEDVGSNLVSIHSKEEDEFVQDLAKSCDEARFVWIGAKVKGYEPFEAEWLDGSEFDYNNFKDVGNSRDYERLEISKYSNKWFNSRTSDKDRTSFVCKAEPKVF